MGAANMGGAFFQSYTCAGSFSRTAVVASTGGKSQLAGIVTAVSVVLTLMFLTPFFTHVPKAVLAACLIVAVSSLIDTKRIGELWGESKVPEYGPSKPSGRPSHSLLVCIGIHRAASACTSSMWR